MFVERCIEASNKLFHLLSPLTSVTQMKNVKYMKIVNTFIICWNNFKRTHAYLGMGGRDMGIEGNKQIQGRSLSPTSDEWKYALTWGVCLTQLFTSEIRNKQKICFETITWWWTIQYYVPWQLVYIKFSSSSKRGIQKLSLVMSRERKKRPCTVANYGSKLLPFLNIDWTRLKSGSICFWRISPFCFFHRLLL